MANAVKKAEMPEEVKAKVKKKRKKAQVANAVAAAPADPMTQCVTLCQQKRWRDALLLCRRIRAKAEKDGNEDLYMGLSSAQSKIEYSLRRQMAAALIESARELLAKEYLLDVGE